jgi:DNA-binding NarL/FixJ family response regulator
MTAAPLQIVVADDHAVVRRGVRALLETRSGWQIVAEAADGREAIRAVKQHRPNVVVMDVSLPDLNGLEATRQIVKDFPETEVVILTMHQSEQLMREVLEAGARGYVLKSDADQNLIAAVESLRQHKPFLTPRVTEFVLDGFMRGADYEGQLKKDPVTPREREIIQLIAEGHSSKEVSNVLHISVKTVEVHRANLMRKLHLRSISDIVRYAIRNNIVEP